MRILMFVLIVFFINLQAVKNSAEFPRSEIQKQLNFLMTQKNKNHNKLVFLQNKLKQTARRDHEECPICYVDMAEFKKNKQLKVMRRCCCKILCRLCYGKVKARKIPCPFCRNKNCW